MRSDIIDAAGALNLEVIAGDALNIVALRASEAAAAKLRSAGFDYRRRRLLRRARCHSLERQQIDHADALAALR